MYAERELKEFVNAWAECVDTLTALESAKAELDYSIFKTLEPIFTPMIDGVDKALTRIGQWLNRSTQSKT